MSELSIQQVSPNSTALNAEHYQSFEMAKANDGILGGDDIAQIRSYAAYARAQAQAIHKTIAATSGIDDVAAIKAEATETAQTFAKVGIYADQRIGELLRELPKAKAGRKSNDSTAVEELSKADALKEAGIKTPTAYQLEQLAANPEVVEAVIAKATEEGRVVSRSQVLKAIKERDEARKDAEEVSELYGKVVIQRDQAESERKRVERELRKASITQTNLEMEAESLKQQLSQKPEPEVIERTVEVEVESPESKRRIAELEYSNQLNEKDNATLRRQLEETRKKLDRAKVLLEEKGYEDNASWDISALTSATNQYLRTYGGKLWAFDQFYRVDEVTQQEFVKAITNLAAFAQGIVQYISDANKLEA